MQWEVVIGLENHVQLTTQSKIFSGSANRFGAAKEGSEANGKRPVGLQIIGNYFAEAKLLNIAHQYQQATDWHTRAPEGV